MNDLTVCWRKCIRYLLNVNPMTHRVLVPHLIDKIDLKFDLLSRFSKFLMSCVNSSSKVVQYCIKISRYGRSLVADNIRLLMSYLNIDELTLYNHNAQVLNLAHRVKEKWKSHCSAEDLTLSRVVIELLKLKDGDLHCLFIRH